MRNSSEHTYLVEGMSCGHCRAAVAEEVERVPGVASVDVDLASGRVTVHGQGVDDRAVRAAIDAAGYEATPGNDEASDLRATTRSRPRDGGPGLLSDSRP